MPEVDTGYVLWQRQSYSVIWEPKLGFRKDEISEFRIEISILSVKRLKEVPKKLSFYFKLEGCTVGKQELNCIGLGVNFS